jgi:hypothetical protein
VLSKRWIAVLLIGLLVLAMVGSAGADRRRIARARARGDFATAIASGNPQAPIRGLLVKVGSRPR